MTSLSDVVRVASSEEVVPPFQRGLEDASSRHGCVGARKRYWLANACCMNAKLEPVGAVLLACFVNRMNANLKGERAWRSHTRRKQCVWTVYVGNRSAYMLLLIQLTRR